MDSPKNSKYLIPTFALLLLYISTVQAAAQGNSSLQVASAPMGNHRLYAPIAGISGFPEWELALINHDSGAHEVTATIFSAEGKPYSPTSLPLGASETRHINIMSLVPQEARSHPLGGMALDYDGPPMVVAAQITLTGPDGFGSMDVPFLEDMEFKSSTLDGIWWEPEEARSFLALGNSSADTLHAVVTFRPGLELNVELRPYATELTRVPDNDQSSSESEVGTRTGRIQSVHITSDGMPGALRVGGFSTSLPSPVKCRE